MITLQGVIIFRISDFRRFFDWGEFWSKKEEFISLFRNEINRCTETPGKKAEEYFFVNNEAEFCLVQKLYEWLINPDKDLLGVRLEMDELKIDTITGAPQTYSLGRLKQEIINVSKQNLLTSKAIKGYTLLYLLAEANKQDSDVVIEYGNPLHNNADSVQSVKEYNRCWGDVILEPAESIEYPLRRCAFVNVNTNKEIRIIFGEQVINIGPKECVVGLFCNNKCYKMLPNTLTGHNSRVTLVLKSSMATGSLLLEIHNPDRIDVVENVVSIGLDSNEKPVYLSSDGKVHYERKNFILEQHYNGFCNSYDASGIIAIEVNNDNLTIYTRDRKY